MNILNLYKLYYIDREGLHRTIKADIANSTNVNPSYTGISNEMTISLLSSSSSSSSLSFA